MESVEESPPSTEDDRRARPAESEEPMQGGLAESKLPVTDEMQPNGYSLAQPEPGMEVDLLEYEPDTNLKELMAVLTRDAKQ